MDSNQLWVILDIVYFPNQRTRNRVLELNIVSQEIYKYLGAAQLFSKIALSEYSFEVFPMDHISKLKKDSLIIS